MNKIKMIIAEQFFIDPEEIDDDTILTDLGMDSLDLVELIITFEEEFDIDIDDKTFETVGDVIALVEDLI